MQSAIPSDREPPVRLEGRRLASVGHRRRIRLDIVRAPLSDVVRLLADVRGINIVLDDAIASKPVTVRLVDVPWDDALGAIVFSQGLALEQTSQASQASQNSESTVYVRSPPRR